MRPQARTVPDPVHKRACDPQPSVAAWSPVLLCTARPRARLCLHVSLWEAGLLPPVTTQEATR